MAIIRDPNPDGIVVYDETSVGADIRRFPGFDLGLIKGGIAPTVVFTLDATAEDEGVFVDETKKARGEVTGTFTAIPLADAQYDALYIMCHRKITGAEIDIDTAGVDGGSLVATWEYPSAVDSEDNPSTWSDLIEEDNSATAAGKGLDSGTGKKTVKFVPPTDWKEAVINGQKGYWIKFMVGTAGYTTAPIIDTIDVVVSNPGVWMDITSKVNDDCNVYPNSEIVAGSYVDQASPGIPVDSGVALPVGDLVCHNLVIKNLGNTNLIKILVKGFTGSLNNYT